MATDTMSIQKNCGSDNVCVPNLVIKASGSEAFVYGGKDNMEITANIFNYGEDAFNARFYMQLPKEDTRMWSNYSLKEEPSLIRSTDMDILH